MLGELLGSIRKTKPLVHCITNSVTTNDCANILLACGASAIMADDPRESAEITSVSRALVLNLGTPGPDRISAMLRSGEQANRMGIPVVLDPVGAALSELRRSAAHMLLARLQISAIRGNAAEIAFLAGGGAPAHGVDAGNAASGCADRSHAAHLARKSGAVVVLTGETDLITDGSAAFLSRNGHPIMRAITGAGCQLSALLGAYLGANPGQEMHAALAAVCAMGLCGEIAREHLAPWEGSASCRNRIIDAVYHLTPDELEKGARYEIYK